MKSLAIFILFPLFLLALYSVFLIRNKSQTKKHQDEAWPEVLDLIISALQSGASISESLANLGRVGPKAVQNKFKEFEKNLSAGSKFEDCLNDLKQDFSNPITDQLFECLYFTAKFGSKNAVKVLRELSEYVSADLALRSEISTRFGWIKNSANLAAIAPWILLFILRTQENARVAYLQPTGRAIMIFGVIATLTAYLWMNKIARLPKAKRLFTMQIVEK